MQANQCILLESWRAGELAGLGPGCLWVLRTEYRWADGVPNNPLVRDLVRSRRKSKERRGWIIFPVALLLSVGITLVSSVIFPKHNDSDLGHILSLRSHQDQGPWHSRWECEHALRLLSPLAHGHAGAVLKRPERKPQTLR